MSDDKFLYELRDIERKIDKLTRLETKIRKIDDAILILKRLDKNVESMKMKLDRLDKFLEKAGDRLGLFP